MRHLRSAVAVVFVLAGATLPAKPPADAQAKLDAYVKGRPGGIAVAWIDADGAEFLAAGKFSATDARPIDADTRFQAGSVTKIFTALLLAESERAGKVSRNDSAAKYLLPAGDRAQTALAKITLLSLTTHTSGLPRLPSNIGPNPDNAPDPYGAHDHTKLVEALRIDGPGAVPAVGRAVAYSNFGVSVLGEALGGAWGTSYVEALTAKVLAPLQMKATTLALGGAPLPAQLAPGHAEGRAVPPWTFLAAAPAGALVTSARDLATFLAFCLARGDGPLRAALVETMKPQFPTPEMGGRIGMGWFITDGKSPVYYHNGATNAYHAFVGFQPETGRGVAVLVNEGVAIERIAWDLLGVKPPQPASRVVANARDYAGRYPLAPTFAIDVTERGGALSARATGQPALPLRSVGPDRFALVGVAAEISFERDAAGAVAALVLHQNGRDQRAPRGALLPAPKEISLPAETLRDYPGRFALAPGVEFTITTDGSGLFAQLTGQPKAPVFASARDEFFYKIVEASLTFERDAAGKVIALVLHQSGRDQRAKRSD